MNIDVRALAQALRGPQRLMGITPSPPNPPKAPPCATLGTVPFSMGNFSEALQNARVMWPEAVKMALIGGEVEETRGTADLSDDAIRIQDPETLLEFDAANTDHSSGPSDPGKPGSQPGSRHNPDRSTLMQPPGANLPEYLQGQNDQQREDQYVNDRMARGDLQTEPRADEQANN